MTQRINLSKFIVDSNYCELSHMLLDFLDKSITNIIEIDLSNCVSYDFLFEELLDHFDVWFPKRIKIINY